MGLSGGDLYKVLATIPMGFNSIKITFDCLDIEWNHDFTAVAARAKGMIKNNEIEL